MVDVREEERVGERPPALECAACAEGFDSNEPQAAADLLDGLTVGDIFHAGGGNGSLEHGSFICLVTGTTPVSIAARRITTQEDLIFSRRDGCLLEPSDRDGVRINSVEPLPIDLHSTLLGLDRRYRLGRTFARFRLTQHEIAALLDAGRHFKQHRFEQSSDEQADAE
jgi:hypothetical protein